MLFILSLLGTAQLEISQNNAQISDFGHFQKKNPKSTNIEFFGIKK
jgi:hypothetical protein